jgi:cytochrome c-type biogenesis protein CcmH
MTTFILIAALMAAGAAAAVAWPLLKERRTRWQGAVAGVVLIALAAVLYPRWSNWDWHNASGVTPSAARSPEVLAMVARLEERLRAQPNDLDGWLMLGRSYMTLERFEDASQAYVHALKLNDSSVEAMLGLGEALSMRAGGSIPPPAADLFERALTLSPQEPRALLYGGFAAAVRGDKALARARWEALKQLNPPPQIVAILDQRIAELGAAGPGEAAGEVPASASGGSGQAAQAAPGAPGAAGGGEATINLSIAPALKSKLTGNPLLFVFAREPGASGPPLAVKRLTSAAIGTQVHLSAADSMVPGRALSRGQRISITARVSFSGQPLPAAGDLYGELTYEVGRDGARDLVIDRVAQ